MINNLKRIGLMLACAIIGICMQAQDVTREWVEQHYTKREVMIPMRDGVKLFTSIYEPIDATKQTPIIMQLLIRHRHMVMHIAITCGESCATMQENAM